jgi:hypothetical protein
MESRDMAMGRGGILDGFQVARSDKKEEGPRVGNRGHCLTRVAWVNVRRTIQTPSSAGIGYPHH